jgi:hypothetical protein
MEQAAPSSPPPLGVVSLSHVVDSGGETRLRKSTKFSSSSSEGTRRDVTCAAGGGGGGGGEAGGDLRAQLSNAAAADGGSGGSASLRRFVARASSPTSERPSSAHLVGRKRKGEGEGEEDEEEERRTTTRGEEEAQQQRQQDDAAGVESEAKLLLKGQVRELFSGGGGGGSTVKLCRLQDRYREMFGGNLRHKILDAFCMDTPMDNTYCYGIRALLHEHLRDVVEFDASHEGTDTTLEVALVQERGAEEAAQQQQPQDAAGVESGGADASTKVSPMRKGKRTREQEPEEWQRPLEWKLLLKGQLRELFSDGGGGGGGGSSITSNSNKMFLSRLIDTYRERFGGFLRGKILDAFGFADDGKFLLQDGNLYVGKSTRNLLHVHLGDVVEIDARYEGRDSTLEVSLVERAEAEKDDEPPMVTMRMPPLTPTTTTMPSQAAPRHPPRSRSRFDSPPPLPPGGPPPPHRDHPRCVLRNRPAADEVVEEDQYRPGDGLDRCRTPDSPFALHGKVPCPRPVLRLCNATT